MIKALFRAMTDLTSDEDDIAKNSQKLIFIGLRLYEIPFARPAVSPILEIGVNN